MHLDNLAFFVATGNINITLIFISSNSIDFQFFLGSKPTGLNILRDFSTSPWCAGPPVLPCGFGTFLAESFAASFAALLATFFTAAFSASWTAVFVPDLIAVFRITSIINFKGFRPSGSTYLYGLFSA